MFTVKRFKDGPDIYHYDWKSNLPKSITIIQRGKEVKFDSGNVMMHFDMIQCTYENPNWGFPDTLEFDFYFLKDVNKENFKIDIDITLGDAMVCEFSLEVPNKVSVIEYTSWRSKADPSNTVFALEDKSLLEFVNFLNKFTGFELKVSDFKFLDKYDNYNPE
jgi:hypothetical protein